ncbi:MAG: ATP-binding cassette domain-containing protein [Clostridium sp.]
MRYICELKEVVKSYDKNIIINKLNLNIKYGEIVAIVGKSGSGKSTLLNIIGLLENIDNGSIEMFNKPVPKIGSQAHTKILRDKIAYLFQNFALIDNETIEENLEIGLLYSKMSTSEKK